MNQKLILKYKTESLSELSRMNHFITQKISMVHSDVNFNDKENYFPVSLQYLHSYEEEISLKAIQDKKTNLKETDVEYHINSLGYRDEKPIEEMYNSIGVWGCSYTFGVGVPNKYIYSTILSDKIKSPIYNFGIPGAGIQKIAKSFVINNNFFKFKKSFFVLPSLYRFEYVSLNSYDSSEEVFLDTINSFDIIPNYLPSHSKELYRKAKMIYEVYDDASFLVELVRNLELIKQNAEINGTEVYFTTWCDATRRLFVKYGLHNINVVQFIENNEINLGKPVNDFARDGFHPGVRSHQSTADILYDLYQNIETNTNIKSSKDPKFI